PRKRIAQREKRPTFGVGRISTGSAGLTVGRAVSPDATQCFFADVLPDSSDTEAVVTYLADGLEQGLDGRGVEDVLEFLGHLKANLDRFFRDLLALGREADPDHGPVLLVPCPRDEVAV